MKCQRCDVEIEIVRSRDKKKRFCTRACWTKTFNVKGAPHLGKNSAGKPTHGLSRTYEYKTWIRVKQRVQEHPHYLKRGITLATCWQNDPEAFIAELGAWPGKGWTVERIDNDRGYEPGNIKWATWKEQRANRSDSKR